MGKKETDETIDEFYKEFPIYLNTSIQKEMDRIWIDNDKYIIKQPIIKKDSNNQRVWEHCSTGDKWNVLQQCVERKMQTIGNLPQNKKIVLQLVTMYSDETHYRNAKFWPFYLSLANLPKPLRRLPCNKILAGSLTFLSSHKISRLFPKITFHKVHKSSLSSKVYYVCRNVE